MAKFREESSKELPPVSTASLPDIVFMLLFFFMVSTSIKEVELKVAIKAPQATEIKKLEKKSLVSNIYVGEPKKQFVKNMGTEPRIQLNDQFAEISDIGSYIEEERSKISEAERPFMTISLKVDEKTKMGIVTDLKQQLRRVSALKINYSTRKMVKEE
ncbi:MAG: biopolymer transporter ExbD [Salinivirgaceae bacterium]|nr:biopolymer transporter ExbD [Salinivirgaceae bacterium]